MGLGGLGSGRGRLGVGLVEFCIFGTWLGRDLHKLTVWGGGGVQREQGQAMSTCVTYVFVEGLGFRVQVRVLDPRALRSPKP